jgi:hypothetical protein
MTCTYQNRLDFISVGLNSIFGLVWVTLAVCSECAYDASEKILCLLFNLAHYPALAACDGIAAVLVHATRPGMRTAANAAGEGQEAINREAPNSPGNEPRMQRDGRSRAASSGRGAGAPSPVRARLVRDGFLLSSLSANEIPGRMRP